MIHAYWADITPLLDEKVYKKYYEKAPSWRKEKASRMRRQLGKAQSIGVWTLLELARKEIGAGEMHPYNLSHSGNHVLCAICDEPDELVHVGCDVEVIEKMQLNLAKRFYTELEYERIQSALSEAEKTELFFRFWVLKESFMKATRQGMALDTRAFEIEIPNVGSPRLVKQPAEFTKCYYYKEYEVRKANGGSARAAVCATQEAIVEELRILDVVNS